MIDKPLVSIGMPAYNGEGFIKKALDSLLAQDYSNFEVIISDNASTDKTLQICEEYAQRDNRIRIHKHSHKVEVWENFKTVFELAQGEYFMWAAVDDYWHQEFVSALVEELNRNPEAGVAMCAVDRVLIDGTPLDTRRFVGRDNPNCKTYLGMALGLVSPRKYNLFIYGLFRTELLRSTISLILAMSSAERWFLVQIALGSRFRYVDRVLHIRSHHERAYYERYPGDEFSRKNLISEQKRIDFAPITTVWRTIFQSEIIPWHRKLYAPIILFRLLFYILNKSVGLNLRKRIRSFIVRCCSPKIQQKILRNPKGNLPE